ncbi:hypothetical protein F5141DRAFT_1213054 [Pisolithus sp. B1]|nr:hypothetical protein F5141DRAFT_1213054 [Pisolithus sp. B1]
MLHGQLLPHSTSTLASVVTITFISSKKIQKNWLRTMFRVQRTAVLEALLWLKSNNSFYGDISVSEERLWSLPIDDVPDVVDAVVRQETNELLAVRERESYVPELSSEGVFSESEVIGCNEVPQNDLGSSPTDERRSDDEGEVIPLHFNGVSDTDQTQMSSNDLMAYALANLKEPIRENGYAVRHGTQPVDDFGLPQCVPSGPSGSRNCTPRNPLAAAYPNMFVGLCNITTIDSPHTTHSLSSVSAYLKNTLSIAKLTVEDLKQVEEDEARKILLTNPAVRLLRKHVVATNGRVLGSDHAHAAYHGMIWGTCLFLGGASLWITINPADVHDPVTQIFAGCEIDMDKFSATMGPNANQRACNIARNPYAAAKYFHFTINTVLETLFAIKSKAGRVQSSIGVLGHLSAYFGVVEAQGRGMLHLHMLLWLQNAPHSDDIHHLLQTSNFRERIRNFIKRNIQAHLDGFTEETIQRTARDAQLAYSCPPDPRSSTWTGEYLDLEKKLLLDYECRGSDLEDISFMKLIIDTYEELIPAEEREKRSSPSSIPTVDMLALTKPWRQLSDLKSSHQCWSSELEQWLLDAPSYVQTLVAGIQYYYDAKLAGEAKSEKVGFFMDDEDQEGIEPESLDDSTIMHHSSQETLTEEDVLQYETVQVPTCEDAHGYEAVIIGLEQSVFTVQDWNVNSNTAGVQIATGGDLTMLGNWQQTMASYMAETNVELEEDNIQHTGDISSLDTLQLMDDIGDVLTLSSNTSFHEALEPIEETNLLEDQQRAFDIIHWHLLETKAGHTPPTLQMIIPGEGGVGKSKTIQTITEDFQRQGLAHILVKGAYTGIAASMIDGKTLHVLGMIPLNGRPQSAKVQKKLTDFWQTKDYLIIDEISMVS